RTRHPGDGTVVHEDSSLNEDDRPRWADVKIACLGEIVSRDFRTSPFVPLLRRKSRRRCLPLKTGRPPLLEFIRHSKTRTSPPRIHSTQPSRGAALMRGWHYRWVI